MTTSKKTQVLLVDDHEVVRYGLRALVAASADYNVCGEAANGRDAVALAEVLRPDIVVMDIGMPILNGFEATRQVLINQPKTQVLVLSMHQSDQLVREVIEAGARGYVLKSDAARDLMLALDALRSNQTFFTSRVANLIERSYEFVADPHAGGRKGGGNLTRRERETLQLVAEGNSNKGVAQALSISVKTAEIHRAKVMSKLKMDSVADLVRYAIRNDIIEP